MKTGDPQEQVRSHLVEQFCPYVNKKVLGFRTFRLIPLKDASGEVQPNLREEVLRADCLVLESCQNLGCQTGSNPFA